LWRVTNSECERRAWQLIAGSLFHAGPFSSLLGVVVGFVLAISWDQWKTHSDQQTEFLRAARSVYQELIADSAAIKFDIQYLETDLAAAQSNSEVVLSMQNLMTVAGDTAYLKGSFEYRSVEMAIKLRTLCSSLSSINRRIEQREFYRLTNAAMDDFQRRRSIIDAAIKDELVTQQKSRRLIHCRA
jgi:hypothetical protein